jgi:predicted transcriptional regulator YheO
MKYLVEIREVHVSTREVEADSAQEALELTSDGAGDEMMLEYSHTLDRETWRIWKVDDTGNELLVKEQYDDIKEE